jgi:hypothetical protein
MSITVLDKPFVEPFRRAGKFIAWLVIAWVSLPALAGITQSERLTYQGRLLDNGAPYNGVVTMNFELWTELGGGEMVASQLIPTVPVSDGLFQVELLFGDRAYEDGLYLQVEADGILMQPRQPITAVPLALHALNGGGEGFWELSGDLLTHDGRVEIATNAEEALVVSGDITGIRAQASGSAIFGTSASGSGVKGVATNSEGENRGISGTSFSSLGYGVYAANTAGGAAIRAEGGTGVRSIAEYAGVDARGDTFGVIGSSGVYGVFGYVDEADGHAAYFVGADGSANYFQREVGIGTDDPQAMLHVEGLGGDSNPNLAMRVTVNDVDKFVVGNLGTSIYDPVFLDGTMTITSFAGGGANDVCRTGAGTLAVCSSSARYKTDIASIGSASELVDKLRPVTFRWIESGEEDYGFVAEEVAAVEPRLATYNADGRVEGVKYRQISALLLRALQEQQRDAERLRADVHGLRVQLERTEQLERQNRLLTDRLDRLEALLLDGSSKRSLARRRD